MSAASTDVTEELSYSLLGGLGLWIGLFLKALPRGLPFAPKGPAAVESRRGWGHSTGGGVASKFQNRSEPARDELD
jgi:hypothetical protein